MKELGRSSVFDQATNGILYFLVVVTAWYLAYQIETLKRGLGGVLWYLIHVIIHVIILELKLASQQFTHPQQLFSDS